MARRLRAALRTLSLLTLVLSLAACEAHGSVAGGGTDNGGGGRVKIGLPF
jgi:hypothetical protein